MTQVLTDRCGRTRSPATMPEFRKGRKPGNAGHTYPPEPLTPDEVLLLIQGCSKTCATGLRNRALIATLWRSGLRVSEALDLHVRDLNFGAATIHVRHGKGDKSRFTVMDEFGWEYIAPWLAKRAKLPGVDESKGYVFCTIAKPVTGGRMASSSVRKTLKDLAEFAGIDKRVHPHGLRHTFAASLADEEVELRVIQALLGHTSLNTTDRYVSHLSPQKVRHVIAARPRPDDAEGATVYAR